MARSGRAPGTNSSIEAGASDSLRNAHRASVAGVIAKRHVPLLAGEGSRRQSQAARRKTMSWVPVSELAQPDSLKPSKRVGPAVGYSVALRAIAG